MNKLWFVAFAASVASSASAFVYDNFPDWDGSVTSGWFGQAQTFVVPVVDNVLVSWTAQFDSGMGSMPVAFSVMDLVGGVPGGTTYFSSLGVVPTGGGNVSFGMSVPLTSGSTYVAVWDFLGYSGSSIAYTQINTVPGNGMWFDGGGWSDFPDLDQVFRAEFRPVPEPGTMLILGASAVAIMRRRRK